ncbi:uncharacterized protein TM35_000341850 [Trypanosoma theileri]|uniref:Uncharacterized protein n=1 Tax=Trypanosoma theileri TaxID=67003 RepID=A0A1X0NM61_9TRYP|nr:uncharacterized protein TM35_000341850 [Trypanosoma theileri]ORC85573.1 hypothetical protein TM35_000341850 [Trypanosoma theileri]
MRRKVVLPFLSGRWISSWNDGSDGYEWKSRALAEKRSLALEYLGDVSKRVQIHDAIRLKADVNRKAIEDTVIPNFFNSSDENQDDDIDRIGEIDYYSLLNMVEGEIDPDSLQHLSSSDASLLRNEFLEEDDSSEAKLLSKWINYRRDTADYQSYASVPEEERTEWSAWYLRNVRATPSNDE